MSDTRDEMAQPYRDETVTVDVLPAARGLGGLLIGAALGYFLRPAADMILERFGDGSDEVDIGYEDDGY